MAASASSPILWRVLLIAGICLSVLPTSLLAQPGAPGSDTYIVGRGETLSEIADAQGIPVDELMQFNAIDDANAIVEGQILRIPLANRGRQSAPDGGHVVQPGETLGGIAAQYGVPVDELMALNEIPDPNTVVEGQILRLPNASRSERSLLEQSRPDDAGAAAPADEITATPSPQQPAATLNRIYTIEAGDTPASIALRNGVDEQALRALNRMQAGAVSLFIGDELLLPATGSELRVSIPEQEYRVAAGDSIGSIARAHDTTLTALLEANSLTDPDAISVGQTLTIPPRIRAQDERRLPARIGPGRNGFYHYTVRQGDTLSNLARDFESTTLALLEYNSLPDEETVYAGLELRIPYGAPAIPARLPPVPLSGTRFMVSLSRQQCWLLQGDEIKHTWNCSTGYGEWITRTGTFAIQSKLEMAQSTGLRLDMPYWLGIYDVGDYENGIHGLPVDWDTGEKIWSTLIGEPATFGCAMLDDDDASVLFALAYLGMPVHVIN